MWHRYFFDPGGVEGDLDDAVHPFPVDDPAQGDPHRPHLGEGRGNDTGRGGGGARAELQREPNPGVRAAGTVRGKRTN